MFPRIRPYEQNIILGLLVIREYCSVQGSHWTGINEMGYIYMYMELDKSIWIIKNNIISSELSPFAIARLEQGFNE